MADLYNETKMTATPADTSIAASAARGAGVTMAGQVVRVLIQTISMIVLTRLLAPEDYGLLAMVLVIVALGELFREFGLTAASVQSTSLDTLERDTLFWINTVVGTAITLLVAGASGFIASAYGDSRIAFIVVAVSPIFILNGVAAQFRASLMRQVRFAPIAIADTLAQFLGLLGALGCIHFLHLGYWSLVAQQLIIFSTTTFVLVAASGWVPSFRFKTHGMRKFYTFGIDYTLTQMLVYLSQNISTIIIGRSFGPTDVGYFSRAMQLASLPVTQISGPATNVSLPILARLKADHQELIRYTKAGQLCITHFISLLACFAIPIMGPLVDNVLGSKWSPIVDLVSFLLLASVFQALSFPTFWLFVSLGLTRSNLYYAIVTRSLQIGALSVAALVSTWLSALMIAITSAIMWPFGLLWIKTLHRLPVSELMWAGIRAVSMYGSAAILAWLCARIFEAGPEGSLVIVVPVYLATLVTISFIKPFRGDILVIVRIIRVMLARRARGGK